MNLVDKQGIFNSVEVKGKLQCRCQKEYVFCNILSRRNIGRSASPWGMLCKPAKGSTGVGGRQGRVRTGGTVRFTDVVPLN